MVTDRLENSCIMLENCCEKERKIEEKERPTEMNYLFLASQKQMYTLLLIHFRYLLNTWSFQEKTKVLNYSYLMLSIHIFIQKRHCVKTLAMQSILDHSPQGAGEPPLPVDCLKWQWEGFWADSLLWKVKGAHSSNLKSIQNTFHWGCFISADVSLGATPTSAFWPKVTGT